MEYGSLSVIQPEVRRKTNYKPHPATDNYQVVEMTFSREFSIPFQKKKGGSPFPLVKKFALVHIPKRL